MDEKIKTALIDIVSEKNFTDDLIDRVSYSYDGSQHRHRPDCAIWPDTTRHVSDIIIMANVERIPVIPRGAGTSLSGMAIPAQGGIVAEVQEAAERGDTVSESSGGTETVLLVEDDDQVRDLAREVLEMNGYTVFDAPGPDEAMDASEQHSGAIDLMLTDIVMPRMNGRDLYQCLSQKRPDMKVLFMSGYAEDAALQEDVLSEASAHIQKPFELSAILEIARQATQLKERRSKRKRPRSVENPAHDLY